MKKVFVTLEKFKILKQEVKNLKTSERKIIADKLSEYRDSVDLVEDTSYKDILQEQADLEEKIDEIENLLDSASIIKVRRSSSKIILGSNVTVRVVGDKKKVKLKIVGSIDADPLIKAVSNESPLGRALIGKKKDEIVEFETPTGVTKYKILEIA